MSQSDLDMLRSDIRRVYLMMRQSGSGKGMALLRCLRSPGVQAMITYRFGHWLLGRNLLVRILLTPLYLMMTHRIRTAWGIELLRSTTIGEGFYIGHFGGIVISPNAVIGKNCSISQGVTIGVAGSGDKRGSPTIGDNVYIGAGAKIFGKIRIGSHVRIGANAVIHKDIPDHAVVVLDPGFKIIRVCDESGMSTGDDQTGEKSCSEPAEAVAPEADGLRKVA